MVLVDLTFVQIAQSHPFVLLVVKITKQEWWSCVTKDDGDLCVMMIGLTLMPM